MWFINALGFMKADKCEHTAVHPISTGARTGKRTSSTSWCRSRPAPAQSHALSRPFVITRTSSLGNRHMQLGDLSLRMKTSSIKRAPSFQRPVRHTSKTNWRENHARWPSAVSAFVSSEDGPIFGFPLLHNFLTHCCLCIFSIKLRQVCHCKREKKISISRSDQ